MPLTVQRRVIFETLLARSDHPTADDVYADVRTRLPGISRATVYRVLETLAQLGLISKPSHPGSVARYDPCTHRHHHLVCTHCQKVIDLDAPSLDRLILPDTRNMDFQIEDFSIHFTGICGACRKVRGVRRHGAPSGRTSERGPPGERETQRRR